MKDQQGSRTPLEIDYEALRQKSVPELLKEQEAIWKKKRCAAGEWILAYETVLKEKGYVMPGYDVDAHLKVTKERHPSFFPSQQKASGQGTIHPIKVQNPVRPLRLLRVLSAAVIVLCTLFVIASATGMGQWLIEFKDGAYVIFNACGQIETEISDVSDYRSMQDALDKNGIVGQIAPTWIPGRFALKSVNVMGMPDGLMISANYVTDNKDALNVFVTTDPSMHATEGDEPENLEKYKSHGTEFRITSNYDQVSVFWQSGGCYCQIAGELTMTETKAMINSIFKE